jgi:hypothetical protein
VFDGGDALYFFRFLDLVCNRVGVPMKAEPLAHLIDQIPLVGKMQRRTLAGENGEGRRTDGRRTASTERGPVDFWALAL